MKREFNEYMSRIAHIAGIHTVNDGIYAGEDGCKRFAREFGAAIPDFTRDRREQANLIRSTYSAVCVIAYHLKPPLDAKGWVREVWAGVDKAMAIVPVPMSENYQPYICETRTSIEVYKQNMGLV